MAHFISVNLGEIIVEQNSDKEYRGFSGIPKSGSTL
jgi:hypothetical protein